MTEGREILGFISYGYAQMLLRLDRIEEFLLFLYSHRYHVHTRGSWTAGEVTGITGTPDLLHSRPTNDSLLVRWMLVLEDSDEDPPSGEGCSARMGGSGKTIRIENAPTRWGKVSFSLRTKSESQSVIGSVELTGTKLPGNCTSSFVFRREWLLNA